MLDHVQRSEFQGRIAVQAAPMMVDVSLQSCMPIEIRLLGMVDFWQVSMSKNPSLLFIQIAP